MGAVLRLTRRRLASRWRPLLASGLLLGLGFGLCLASLTVARRTASAYDRVLVAFDAEDGTLSHGLSPQEAGAVLDEVDGITDHRAQVGFIGSIAGVDPALTRGLLASTDDEFVIELPRLSAGRLPDPDRADEVFVNSFLAREADLEVGDRIDLNVMHPDGSGITPARATIVGIGALPREAVVDETEPFGVIALTRAFSEAHADLRAYATSRIFLAPGVDARRDIAPQVGELGFEMSEARNQDRERVNDSLRPLVIILVALGVLAFIATTIVAGQIIQRDQERWRADDERLTVLGMVRPQVLLVRMATSGAMAVIAVVTAIAVMVATSPVAPLGPLHEFDPAQGIVVDPAVAVAGLVAIVASILGITAGSALLGRHPTRPTTTAAASRVAAVRRPAAVAGLTLALRTAAGRWQAWRSVGFATAAVVLASVVATLVVSAVTLSDTPSRYGADWDLVAVNAFGDQSEAALHDAFDGDDVVAATGYTGYTFLVNGRAVPGLAATVVKGELGPTVLRGDPVRADDEIVLGQDTLESLDVDIGSTVEVQAAGGFDLEPTARAVELRVVGVATFAAVVQQGTDAARLGIGSLVTRATFDRMTGAADDDPEWTAVLLAEGADPATVIDRNPGGIRDPSGIPTSWFTDAKPAELRQIDSVRSLLVGAVAGTVLVMLAVVGHALWSQARANRRDLAVLGAIGFTPRQLGEVGAWQSAPLAVTALLLGIPLGVALGRWGFSQFAESLAMVDDATISAQAVGALFVAVFAAIAIGTLVAIAVARDTRLAALLREE